MGDVNQNSPPHFGIFLHGCMFTLFVLDLIHLDTTSSLKFQKVIVGCHGNTHYFMIKHFVCIINASHTLDCFDYFCP